MLGLHNVEINFVLSLSSVYPYSVGLICVFGAKHLLRKGTHSKCIVVTLTQM